MDSTLPLILMVSGAVFLTCACLVAVVAVISLLYYATDKLGNGKPSVYAKGKRRAPLLREKDISQLAILVPVTALFGIFGGLFYILLWDD